MNPIDFFRRCFELPPDLRDSAYANFVAWEKLRLLFNAILVVVSVLALVPRVLLFGQAFPLGPVSLIGYLALLPFGAVAANLAYCVGPTVEGYLVMLRIGRGFARAIVFTLGVIAGSMLAFVSVMFFDIQ